MDPHRFEEVERVIFDWINYNMMDCSPDALLIEALVWPLFEISVSCIHARASSIRMYLTGIRVPHIVYSTGACSIFISFETSERSIRTIFNRLCLFLSKYIMAMPCTIFTSTVLLMLGIDDRCVCTAGVAI